MSEESSAADEILDATYRALCTHGYAALTMQDIADEAGKSTSLIHYHYDTKDDLLVAFIDRLLSDFESRVAENEDRPPEERLVEFVARFVFSPDEEERQSFHIALLELRSQGPFNDRILTQLQRSDEQLRAIVEEIIADGIESGTFEEGDPAEFARLLTATLDGARTRQLTLQDPTYTRTVVESVLERVIEPILAEDVELPEFETVLARTESVTGQEEATTSGEPPE